MTDEPATSSEENPKKSEVEAAPVVRRISNPRPKKVPRTVKPDPAETVEEKVEVPTAEPDESGSASEDDERPSEGAEWPEPEAETEGNGPSPADSAKRKRRRRKGKGQGAAPQNSAPAATTEDGQTAAPNELKAQDTAQDQRPRNPAGQPPQQSQPQRARIDPELLTKMAWKIYLAEVSEEGVALIGDNDARDLSRRCFRLAEIFVEEQTRRR